MGAEVQPGGGAHFRVWAPRCRDVAVVLAAEDVDHPLAPEGGGVFSGYVDRAHDGTLYRFRLDGAPDLVADPVSRFQPDGPHGPSRVVDPDTYQWGDGSWRGLSRRGQVIYELHVGTFTPQGTWTSAADELEELAVLGVTVIQMMPVADFPGRFGWGYDGVNLFAPTRLYGEPDDLRAYIDRAHRLGLGVILDVVYNHLGPDGSSLRRLSHDYFSADHSTEWGDSLNFDGPGSERVREFVLANAGYWIDEYHFDGLRLDATQEIRDGSAEHILAAVARRVRESAGGRGTLLTAENEPQNCVLIRPSGAGGYGLDMLCNDDFHHAAAVAMTGRNAAYYTDYRGTAQEFVSAAKYGFLYQGQWYSWQSKPRGTPTTGLRPEQVVNYLQNHDQVANSSDGKRIHLHCAPGTYRAMTALLLLLPGTPMLFQGQEFAASAPFLFFADHKGEIAARVAKGRAAFLAQFPAIALPQVQRTLSDPSDPATFGRCKLDRAERRTHAEIYSLYQSLLRLRREDEVIAAPVSAPVSIDGAVLADGCFLLRYRAAGQERLLLVNLGRDLDLSPGPEPLLAPPLGARWAVRFSTEDPCYGGRGTAPLNTEHSWNIPGRAAVLLAAIHGGLARD
jgi:maltooligosyltrehalose trehalohydrolase